jgi:hypothetical protein
MAGTGEITGKITGKITGPVSSVLAAKVRGLVGFLGRKTGLTIFFGKKEGRRHPLPPAVAGYFPRSRGKRK